MITNSSSLVTQLLNQSHYHHVVEVKKELGKIQVKIAAIHHWPPRSIFITWHLWTQMPYPSHISMGNVSYNVKLANTRLYSLLKKVQKTPRISFIVNEPNFTVWFKNWVLDYGNHVLVKQTTFWNWWQPVLSHISMGKLFIM